MNNVFTPITLQAGNTSVVVRVEYRRAPQSWRVVGHCGEEEIFEAYETELDAVNTATRLSGEGWTVSVAPVFYEGIESAARMPIAISCLRCSHVIATNGDVGKIEGWIEGVRRCVLHDLECMETPRGEAA